jgi:predicted PurR-regulated permease PerM
MSEKKVVGRGVAIGLGIICILLAVGLVGAIANYASIINGKDNTISSLNSQVSDITSTLNLGKSTVWVNDETLNQPSGSYTNWSPAFSTSYAGYISVQVHTSTTSNTYVRVIYTSHGVNYDNQIGVGTGGTAVFPVLPSSSVDVRIGNSNWLNGATETVTITYHY